MSKIEVYIEFWENLRLHGLKTIQVIENANAWEYKINVKEYSVRETFHHTIQAIFEDAGNWFLNDSTRYKSSGNPQEDLNQAINRMIQAIKEFKNKELNHEFTFQWDEKTTIGGAIRQNLLHAVGHFSQLRNWIGIYKRSSGKQTEKTYL